MKTQKQPTATLAFNRQHTRGTVPTHLQPSDIAPRQQAASWDAVLGRAIPTAGSRDAALNVLNTVVAFINDRRWYDLAALASCANYIAKTTPEQRLTDTKA
jgi:hypothetical protein